MCYAMPSFKFSSLNFIILLMMLCFLPLIKSDAAANSTNSSEIQEIRDADKRLTCYICEPKKQLFPECRGNSGGQFVAARSPFCYYCFIEQVWARGKFQYERRGCLISEVAREPGIRCGYSYPVSGVDMDEVRELCICNGSLCNGADTTIHTLGGFGDVKKFPTTTTPEPTSGGEPVVKVPFKPSSHQPWKLIISLLILICTIFQIVTYFL